MEYLEKKTELIAKYGRRWLENEYPFVYPYALQAVELIITSPPNISKKELYELSHIPFQELGYTSQEMRECWCKICFADNKTYEILTHKLNGRWGLMTKKAEKQFMEWAKCREYY